MVELGRHGSLKNFFCKKSVSSILTKPTTCTNALVAELADASLLKSDGKIVPCGFDPRLEHKAHSEGISSLRRLVRLVRRVSNPDFKR